jgi:histone H3/H4
MRPKGSTCYSAAALGAVQEATEHAILQIMQMSNLAAIHANRVMLMKKDMDHIRRVFNVHDPSIWFSTDWHAQHRAPGE